MFKLSTSTLVLLLLPFYKNKNKRKLFYINGDQIEETEENIITA